MRQTEEQDRTWFLGTELCVPGFLIGNNIAIHTVSCAAARWGYTLAESASVSADGEGGASMWWERPQGQSAETWPMYNLIRI